MSEFNTCFKNQSESLLNNEYAKDILDVSDIVIQEPISTSILFVQLAEYYNMKSEAIDLIGNKFPVCQPIVHTDLDKAKTDTDIIAFGYSIIHSLYNQGTQNLMFKKFTLAVDKISTCSAHYFNTMLNSTNHWNVFEFHAMPKCLMDFSALYENSLLNSNSKDFKMAIISLIRGCISEQYKIKNLNLFVPLVMNFFSIWEIGSDILPAIFMCNITLYKILKNGTLCKKIYRTKDSLLFPRKIVILIWGNNSAVLYTRNAIKHNYPEYLYLCPKVPKLFRENKLEIIQIVDKAYKLNKCQFCKRETQDLIQGFENCSSNCTFRGCPFCTQIFVGYKEQVYVQCPTCHQYLTRKEIHKLNNDDACILKISQKKIAPICEMCKSCKTNKFTLKLLHGGNDKHYGCINCLKSLLNVIKITQTNFRETAICPYCLIPIDYTTLLHAHPEITMFLEEKSAERDFRKPKNNWIFSENICFVIFSYLETKFLFQSIDRLSKNISYCVHHRYFIFPLLRREFGIINDFNEEVNYFQEIENENYIIAEKEYINSYQGKGFCEFILKDLLDKKYYPKIEYIKILGIRTDGGSQNYLSLFDMKNAFGLKCNRYFEKSASMHRGVYCSAPGTQNINFTGILFVKPQQINHPYLFKAINKLPIKYDYLPGNSTDPKLIQIDSKEQEIAARSRLFVAREIHISTQSNFTCPLRTGMIYFHNRPIEYNEELLTIFNNKTHPREIRQLLQNNNKIPNIAQTNIRYLSREYMQRRTEDIEHLAELFHNITDLRYIEFDQKGYMGKTDNLRVAVWFQLPEPNCKFTLNLHQNIAARFITVKMIDFYLARPEMLPNIDVKHLKVYGYTVPSLITSLQIKTPNEIIFA